MIWFIFSITIIISLISEIYLYRRVVRSRCKIVRVIYVCASALIWGATIVGMTAFAAARDISPLGQRIIGFVLIAFTLNGVSKSIFIIFDLIGRMTGKVRALRISAALIMTAFCVIILYSAVITTNKLRVESVEIVSDKIAESTDGLRIVVFSDMHAGLLRYSTVERMVDKINSLDADIVINCGDIVNRDYRELSPKMIEILSGIKGRYGIYSVIGNHDLGIYISDTTRLSPAASIEKLSAAQKSMGWILLRDSTAVLPIGKDTITVTGIEYPQELIHASHHRLQENTDIKKAYGDTDPGRFNITVSHAPQTWQSVLSSGYGDLTLSGHVHSLQMKFSIFGRSFSPAALLYDQWSGRYDAKGKMLYINDGVGFAMIPLRIGTRPEITLIELKK